MWNSTYDMVVHRFIFQAVIGAGPPEYKSDFTLNVLVQPHRPMKERLLCTLKYYTDYSDNGLSLASQRLRPTYLLIISIAQTTDYPTFFRGFPFKR